MAESGILYPEKGSINFVGQPHKGSDKALRMIKKGVAAKSKTRPAKMGINDFLTLLLAFNEIGIRFAS